MIPCVELHGRSVGHGYMHGIVWNHTDHMRSCMELHGRLMNLDPGRQKIDFKNFSDLFTIIRLRRHKFCVFRFFLVHLVGFVNKLFHNSIDCL